MQHQRLSFSIRSMACFILVCQYVFGFSSESSQYNNLTVSVSEKVIVNQNHTITSASTENELEAIKRSLKKDLVDVLFSNTKRNRKDEIISLTLQFKKNDASEYVKWNLNTKSNTPIQSFVLTLEGDLLSISSENRLWKTFDLNNPNPDRRSNLSFFVTNDSKNKATSSVNSDTKSTTETSVKRSRSVAPFKLGQASDKIENNGSPIEVSISKSSTDDYLNEQRVLLKSFGITAEFSKIKRNRRHELTRIQVLLSDQNGQKSSASWSKKNTTVPEISIGRSNESGLFIIEVDN